MQIHNQHIKTIWEGKFSEKKKKREQLKNIYFNYPKCQTKRKKK